MGPRLVVTLQPRVRGFPDLVQTREEVRIERLRAVGSLGALDVRVLVGLSGPDGVNSISLASRQSTKAG